MKARVDFAKVLLPKAIQALNPIAKYVNSSGLDHRLLELVKMRTSQAERSDYMPYLRLEPMLDSLRSDHRFAALVGRVGLPSR